MTVVRIPINRPGNSIVNRPLPWSVYTTSWFALHKYRDQLEHDLKTQYDGDPNFRVEDREFLEATIKDVINAIQQLEPILLKGRTS